MCFNRSIFSWKSLFVLSENANHVTTVTRSSPSTQETYPLPRRVFRGRCIAVKGIYIFSGYDPWASLLLCHIVYDTLPLPLSVLTHIPLCNTSQVLSQFRVKSSLDKVMFVHDPHGLRSDDHDDVHDPCSDHKKKICWPMLSVSFHPDAYSLYMDCTIPPRHPVPRHYTSPQ